MKLSLSTTTLCYGALFLGLVNAIGIKPLFKVDVTTDDNGGCKSHNTDLKNSYAEALSAINFAKSNLDIIRNDRPDPADDEQGSLLWGRYARLITAVFGIPVDGTKGLDGNGDFETVYNNFDALLTVGTGKKTSYYLYCNDDWLSFKKADDKDPTNPDQLVKDNPDFEDGWTGIWYAEVRNQFFFIKNDDTGKPEPSDHALCRTGVTANVLLSKITLTWCDFGMKQQVTLPTAPNEGDYIDSMHDSMTGTWLHELTHLFLDPQTIDIPAVDKDGTPLMDPDTGKQQKVYGYAAVVWTAKPAVQATQKAAGKTTVLGTAEAYSMFAVASYLDSWDWSTGFAEPDSKFADKSEDDGTQQVLGS